ncbi:MAG: VOC family protein [Alphaproteobacteria bacterium]
MKIRTIYFKTSDITAAKNFWQELLGITPHKNFEEWVEFKLDNINLGIWLNDGTSQWSGSSTVPVFEFEDHELLHYIQKAEELGARILLNGLDNPDLLSVVLADPWGNEFELSKFH